MKDLDRLIFCVEQCQEGLKEEVNNVRKLTNETLTKGSGASSQEDRQRSFDRVEYYTRQHDVLSNQIEEVLPTDS